MPLRKEINRDEEDRQGFCMDLIACILSIRSSSSLLILSLPTRMHSLRKNK